MNSTLLNAFQNQFHQDPSHLIRSPGRVNIIGEHTDYNDGFVLPMALENATWLAMRPRQDRQIKLYSLEFNETATLNMDALSKNPEIAGWSKYAAAVVWSLESALHKTLLGFDAVVDSNVPMGAGLSSSAAFELAIARALAAVNQLVWDPVAMAKLCQRAENQWVGVNCGIMDQLICAAGVQDHACLIDCRSLSIQTVPLPKDTVIVILDTMTRRGLVASAYNERRSQCETAAKALGIKMLRDAHLADLIRLKSQLDPLTYRRAYHVISENQRTLDAAAAMHHQDAKKLGQLMVDSHLSLHRDFEVTNEALNTMVNIALQTTGCYGARMTGAGFGGCAVALVMESQQDYFVQQVSTQYQTISHIKPNVYVSKATPGCQIFNYENDQKT